ncbi:MAG: hypothetical protein J0J15_06415, partial [Mesorhizobium sp.]|nr:hypothetical protein [Mesorhizobium sp.]
VGARRSALAGETFDERFGQDHGGILFGKARLLCHEPEVARHGAAAKQNRNKKGSEVNVRRSERIAACSFRRADR